MNTDERGLDPSGRQPSTNLFGSASIRGDLWPRYSVALSGSDIFAALIPPG